MTCDGGFLSGSRSMSSRSGRRDGISSSVEIEVVEIEVVEIEVVEIEVLEIEVVEIEVVEIEIVSSTTRGSESPLSTTRGSPALPRLELSNRYTRRLEFPTIPPSLKFEGKSSPILTRLENARNNVSPDVNT